MSSGAAALDLTEAEEDAEFVDLLTEDQAAPASQQQRHVARRKGKRRTQEDAEAAAAAAAAPPPPKPACALCHRSGAGAKKALGPLLPFRLPRVGGKAGPEQVYVHELCAVWSPQAYASKAPGAQNGLLMVPQEVLRARKLKCTRCSKPGAATGCDVSKCPHTFCLPCALLQPSVRFDCRSWKLFCPEHAWMCSEQAENEEMRTRRLCMASLVRREPPSEAQGVSAGQAASPPPPPAQPSPPPREQAEPAEQRQQPKLVQTGLPLMLQRMMSPAQAAQQQEQEQQPAPAKRPRTVPKRGLAGDAPREEKDKGPASPVTSTPLQRQSQEVPARQEQPQRQQQRQQQQPAEKPQREEEEQQPAQQQRQQQAEQQPQEEQQPAQELQPAEPPAQEAPQEPVPPAAQAQQPAAEEALAAAGGGGALGLLPADVVAFIEEVFGRVAPGTVPMAADYLWDEGVREFGDLRFLDATALFYAVPMTRLLLNKFLMLAKERGDAAAAAAAAAAQLEGGSQ